jgi:hypothetical protein
MAWTVNKLQFYAELENEEKDKKEKGYRKGFGVDLQTADWRTADSQTANWPTADWPTMQIDRPCRLTDHADWPTMQI